MDMRVDEARTHHEPGDVDDTVIAARHGVVGDLGDPAVLDHHIGPAHRTPADLNHGPTLKDRPHRHSVSD
ncbi:hypothetical protein Acsp02_00110 [Actinoplanes sp. NBRC 103695]|nr:hypothetical protein Acsp02_00110 [Actinoplanes sp. NBRC 103695]